LYKTYIQSGFAYKGEKLCPKFSAVTAIKKQSMPTYMRRLTE
jgi:hypothetical protein